jgi:hypothetical protein
MTTLDDELDMLVINLLRQFFNVTARRNKDSKMVALAFDVAPQLLFGHWVEKVGDQRVVGM